MNVMIPRLKPVAPYSWELRAVLPRTDSETSRIPIEFPGPRTIVGAYPSVVRASSAGGLLIPGVDDILALIDVDNQERYTSGPTQGYTNATANTSQYVTLGALSSTVRDLYINLDSPRPVVGVTFRWKRFTQGTPFYEDANIALAFFVVDPVKGLEQ